MPDYYPQRIVCLTEETTETLYILGQQHRIAGISGYTVRPPEARREKPRISAFTSANIEKILALKPDLVLGFSDLQADIAAQLIRHGVGVHIFNQRSVDEILSMITTLGAMTGCAQRAEQWVNQLVGKLAGLRSMRESNFCRPRVYFEEWNDPLISGIRWVSELVELAGGEECFPELSVQPLAKNRIIVDSMEVVRRNPDIIVGSWCGRKFQPGSLKARDGWHAISAVKHDQVFEIKSSNILQPGPAALTDGLDQLVEIVENWRIHFALIQNNRVETCQ